MLTTRVGGPADAAAIARLWTAANVRARRLYERIGWTPSGRSTTDERGEEIRHCTRDL